MLLVLSGCGILFQPGAEAPMTTYCALNDSDAPIILAVRFPGANHHTFDLPAHTWTIFYGGSGAERHPDWRVDLVDRQCTVLPTVTMAEVGDVYTLYVARDGTASVRSGRASGHAVDQATAPVHVMTSTDQVAAIWEKPCP